MSTRNSIQFAILGMVSLRPMTGYEIKQSYERGPANFMPISYGQIYPLLKKLAAEGLVVGRLEAGGRERQRYSITMDGRKLIKAWLTAESGAQVSHKELLLKLFFMTPGELGLIQGQMNGFHKEEAQRLEHYRRARSWLRSEHGDNSRLEIWEMVLDYGVGQSEARVRWSEEILRKMRHGKAKRQASKSA